MFDYVSDGSMTLYSYSSESAGKTIRNETHDYMERLPICQIDYKATDTAPMCDTTTDSELWFIQRHNEYVLLCSLRDRLAKTCYKQLCVFQKKDNAHKALRAVALFIPQTILWFDVVDGTLQPRGYIKAKTVSQALARKLCHAPNGTTVYLQTMNDVIHAHEKRMNRYRREYGTHTVVPRDRMPQRYMQRGMPLGNVEFTTRQKSNDRYAYYSDPCNVMDPR